MGGFTPNEADALKTAGSFSIRCIGRRAIVTQDTLDTLNTNFLNNARMRLQQGY
jgi:hypothetical protein